MVDVKSLIDEVTCNICYEIPPEQVFQCYNGHAICASCVKPLKNCPQCRVLYGAQKIRCLLMENLLDNLKLSCPFKGCGCNESLTVRDYNEHELKCCYRADKSVNLCKEMGFKHCPFLTASASTLASHLQTTHGAPNWSAVMWTQFIHQYYIPMNSIRAVYVHHLIYPGRPQPTVQFATYVQLEFPPQVASPMFSCVSLYLGDDPQQASNYLVTFKLTTTEMKEVLTWTGPPVYFKQGGNLIKDKMLPFQISPVDIIKKTHFCADFNLVLTIYISPKVQTN